MAVIPAFSQTNEYMTRPARFVFLFLLLPLGLFSQSQPKPDLSTPFGALNTHLFYLQPDSYQADLAARPIHGVKDAAEAQSLAIKLKQVLDGKGLHVKLEEVPDEPDFLDSISGKNQYVLFPDELPEVYLQKIGDNWYYSLYTIELIPSLHKKVYPFGSDLLVNLIPKYGAKSFLGLALWQYLGFFILLLITWIVHFFLSRLLRPVVHRLSRSRIYPATVPEKLVFSIARITSIWALILAWKWIVPLLHLPIEWVGFIMSSIRIGATVLFMVLGLRILEIVVLYLRKYTLRTPSPLDNQLVPIIQVIIQLLIITVAVIQILNLLDVNVTALIAGVSIGGLALALAAQDTVKNLIGSVMIFFDRPFQIGDWIIGDTFEGKVMEVGFRTTRIQNLDSSIVAVPNGNLANISVRNLGVRIFRLLDVKLSLKYDTPPQKIEWFLEGLKKLVQTHPFTNKEVFHVRLFDMAEFSLQVLYRVAIKTDNYDEELRIREELLMGAIRLAATLGIDFAFPTSTIHVESFPGQLPGGGKKGPQNQEEMEAAIEGLIRDFEQRVQKPIPPDDAL